MVLLSPGAVDAGRGRTAAGDRMDGKSNGLPVLSWTEAGPGNVDPAYPMEEGHSDTSRTSPVIVMDSLALPGTEG